MVFNSKAVSMKWIARGVIVCLGLFLLIGYGWLLSTPKAQATASLDEGLVAAKARADALKLKGTDPHQNGFLEPLLLPYWKADGDVKDKNFIFVSSAVERWTKDFSAQSIGHEVDHAALLKVKSVDYLAARKGFEELLPHVVAALDKPMFSSGKEGIHVFRVLQLTRGLDGYAESLVAEGELERASLVYQLVFLLGDHVGRGGGVLQMFGGISCQALGFQSLVGHLSDADHLGLDSWAGLSRTLSYTTPMADAFTEAIQVDAQRGLEFLSEARSSYDGEARFLRGVFLLPGLRARDIRIYRNVMTEILGLAGAQKTLPVWVAPGFTHYLEGRTGAAFSSLIPEGGYRVEAARLRFHNAKMTGLCAYTALCAYRAKHGHWPERLEDLASLHLKAPGGQPWQETPNLLYRTNKAERELAVLLPERLYEDAGVNLLEAANNEAGNSTYFRLDQGKIWFVTGKHRTASTPSPL